jgi:hypothetical protein
MRIQSRVSCLIVSVAMAAAVCSAQSVTSAHSGTVHYFEGDVSIDGTPVQGKTGRFSEIKEQGVLRTGQGRAEVLLTPGVFLRVGENSAIKLLDNRLVSTRVELMSGSVAIESDDPQMSIKDSPVTLVYKGYDITMVKYGLVEINTDPAVMKVFKGEAQVATADSRTVVKEGRQLPFSAALLTEKFDDKTGDDLYLWSRDRSQSLSAASMSSARSLNSSLLGGSSYGYGLAGMGYGLGTGYGPGAWNGGWFFNPYLGMYTFMPGGGNMFMNAFGYGFFSPYSIYNYYSPSTYWYGGGGARGTGMVGQPINIARSSTSTAAPLSTLRGGTSIPALGSPVRGGGVVAAAGTSSNNAASITGLDGSSSGASSSGSRGSGGFASASGGASSAGGMRTGGGGRR